MDLDIYGEEQPSDSIIKTFVTIIKKKKKISLNDKMAVIIT